MPHVLSARRVGERTWERGCCLLSWVISSADLEIFTLSLKMLSDKSDKKNSTLKNIFKVNV